MTNPTPHGQVPEALIDLIDTYAETRHRYGGIYNARTEAARNAVIEALSGVQALSAAPVAFLKSVIALCSHRGYSPANIEVWDKDDKWIADLWRQAESMLTASPTPPAEQQAAPKAAQVDPDKLMRDCLALLESFDYEDDEDSQSKAFFNAHINADWFFHVKHSIERQLEAKWGTQPQAGAVPQGWKAVPVNPTPEMWKAAKSVPDPNPPYTPHYGLVWDAMLAASPTPPAEQQAPKETLGGVNGWRDISTAPKDGSRFVAIGYNYGLYSECRHICVAQWFRGCWMEMSDWNEASELKHLTHWLPLPSPPDNAAELNDIDVSVSPQQAASKAAPGEQDLADVEQEIADTCMNTPPGWRCTRKAGHDGSCAAVPCPEDLEFVASGMERIRKAEAAPQQEAQEPVAWLNPWRADLVTTDYDAYGEHGIPLYTAPNPAPAPLSDDVSQKTWALLDELEKLRGADRYDEDWDTLNKRDDELRAAIAAQGGTP